jgi:O-antigen/teichoic acid export membrane protein
MLLRGLGASEFGILAIAISVSASLSFLDFGLTASSLRYVVSDLHHGDPSSAGRVMTTSLVFFGGLGLLITVTVVLLSPLLTRILNIPDIQHELSQQVLQLSSLQIGLTLLLNTIGGLFKALDRFDLGALSTTLVSISTNAIPAVLIAYWGQPLSLALKISACLLAVLVVLMVGLLAEISRRHGINLSRDLPNSSTFRRIFAFGATLTLHGLIGMLFSHGQRLLVGVMFGPIVVTAYQLSLTLVSKVHSAINAVAEVALPIASSGQLIFLRIQYIRSVFVLGAMSAAPLLFIALTDDWLIHLWLGDSAPPLTAQLLPSLCVAYFFVALSSLPYHILNGMGRPAMNVWFAVFNMVIFVVTLYSFELGNERSAANVANAYAISNAICGVLYQWFVFRALSKVPAKSPN